MEIKSSLALRSYNSALTQPPQPPGTEAEPNAGPVGDFAAEFIQSLREGENAASAGLTGEADPHSVVEALAATKLAVETAVTVRDKVIEAYQEILRMPV